MAPFKFKNLSVRYILSVSLFLFCMAIPSAHGSAVHKMDLADVSQGAEFIFEGRVLSVEERISPKTGHPFTYFLFEVFNVIKGPDSISTIEIGYMGGRSGEFRLEVTDMRMPERDERGIYFVENLNRQQVHPLIGWQQGHYLVITQAKSGQEMVVPVENESTGVTGRALILQHGIPLDAFKQKIQEAMEGSP